MNGIKRAIKIRIDYDDGSADTAEGKQATEIMDWYRAAEISLVVHGGVYKGEKFTVIQAPPIQDSTEGEK